MHMNAPTDKNHAVYFVPGLHRGLQVLEAVGRSDKPLSVTELSRMLELSRSSVFRLVYTLQFMEFLRPTQDQKHFELGARVLNLGFVYLAKQSIISVARRELEVLRDETGISTHLAIRDGLDVLFLDCIQAKTGFLSNMNVGARLPAYASPMGWLMLGELSHREIIALYQGIEFEQFTEMTPTDLPSLTQAIARSTADGYVFSRGIAERSGCSVTAPVFSADGKIAAAVDISGPESAFDASKPEQYYIDFVLLAAARISSNLGYSPAARG